MVNFWKKLLSFTLIFSLWLFLPLKIWAAGEFTADYDVSYAIAPAGNTIVTQNITLTNKLTNLYPKQYSISIDSENIRNVIAYDGGGIISPKITQKDGKTEIFLTFNEQVVGLGKKLNFSLRYEGGDIAQKHGTIWEINIPGIADDLDLGNYSVSLDVPASFGPNAYLSPLPANGRHWTKEQMTSGGISAAYGTNQTFLLDLTYTLENPRVSPQLMEIALPPDTAFQQVSILGLSPKPDDVVKDKDGNWLARYAVAPGQKMEISAKLTVAITLNPRPDFKVELDNQADYLKSDRYWETTSGQIVALAQQYRTPRQIYNYVTSTLTYDYSRVNQNPLRKGALTALANPKNSICMEFTDLFIAIARAAGIPAREVVGYAYTTNAKLRPLSLVSDVLHAWPEYYDRERNLWVPVDPTWASTTGGVNYFDKLDFNHIAFAIHGVSSEYPYPAGFYRNSAKTGKDVKVAFGENLAKLPQPKLSTTVDFPKVLTAGLLARGRIIVENSTSTSVPEAIILVQSSPFNFSLTKRETNIPPFSRIFLPVTLTTQNYLTSTRGRLTITVNDETTNFYFDVRPMYWILLPIGGGLGLILVGLWYLIARPKLWPIFKKH